MVSRKSFDTEQFSSPGLRRTLLMFSSPKQRLRHGSLKGRPEESPSTGDQSPLRRIDLKSLRLVAPPLSVASPASTPVRKIKKRMSSPTATTCSTTVSDISKTHVKKVRFDESRNESSKSAANARFAPQCWSTMEEMTAMKANAVKQAMTIATSTTPADCRYRRVLSSVFTSCCQVGFEIHDIDCTSFLCEGDQQDLIRSIGGGSRMGLERMVLINQNQDLKQIRRESFRKLKALLAANKDTGKDDSQLAYDIRFCLEEASRSSRLFAVEKARALAAQCANKDMLSRTHH